MICLIYFVIWHLIADKLGKFVRIHLHTCLEDGTFKLSRFHVTKNNMRPGWYQGKTEEAKESEQSGKSQRYCVCGNVFECHNCWAFLWNAKVIQSLSSCYLNEIYF